MKHFISFQKRKGLYLEPGSAKNQGIACQIQAELFKYGFVCTKELFDVLSTQSEDVLGSVYADLCKGLQELYGTSGYEPIYRNFPQSVKNMSYIEFLINALTHYWSFSTWRPEDAGYMQREFKLEPIQYREVKLLNKMQFDSIFTDIVYSGSSISKWDKEVVDYFILEGLAPELDFKRISFKETKAYIGQRYLRQGRPLPVRSATDVLRIYAAFSGGDEGLKENTKFKQPNRMVKRSLLVTLDACYDMEESFKTYREMWLRVLFYLNPTTRENRLIFPNLARYADALRNAPATLRTFNSYLEEYLRAKNPDVFKLLKNRKGVYMRRMNELYGIFGMRALDEFIALNPTFEQLITLYNYFSDRDQEKERAIVLAGQSKSQVETFGALKALTSSEVQLIQDKLKLAMVNRIKPTAKSVYIDRALYYSPLASNNRASSFSLNGATIGTIERLDDTKVVRAYVHWVGREDIDLSAFVIKNDMSMVKVGWNGSHHYDKLIVYSGDNTGHSSKNAEYIDLDVNGLEKSGVEWIVVDARVYRGPNFKSWHGEGVHAGWMARTHPESNSHWLPETVSNAMKIQSNSNSAYLFAIHVPTRCLAYMDVAIGGANIISTDKDAAKMVAFLDKLIIKDDGSDKINWNKFAQGHVLNLLASKIVNDPKDAEIVFDENTPWETVAKALTTETVE